MLRDAVHLGINPYGPDKGWTIGGPIDLGARRKTLHPSLCFCAAIGVFPFGSGGAAYMVVCPLAGPGSSSPGRWMTHLVGSYPLPYPSHGLAMIEDSGALSTQLLRHPLLGGHHCLGGRADGRAGLFGGWSFGCIRCPLSALTCGWFATLSVA